VERERGDRGRRNGSAGRQNKGNHKVMTSIPDYMDTGRRYHCSASNFNIWRIKFGHTFVEVCACSGLTKGHVLG